MRTSRIVFCLLLGIIYMACNDTIGRVGLGMQPDEDKINVFDTTVVITARTITVDSIYAKTSNGFLGEFYDPAYGSVKSSYICQFYPSIGFQDLDSIVGNKIDSVRLNLYYAAYMGDSLAPMEVTVYPVVRALDNNYYTNSNPEAYCDMSHPYAKYGYTARNMNLSDSLHQAFRSSTGYYSYVSIPLPVGIGQTYLDRLISDHKQGLPPMSLDDFLDFFKGAYLSTTYGTGCLLPIDVTQILLYYTHMTGLKDVNGNDSTYVASAAFTVTKEIIQLNKFENNNPKFLTADNSDSTFIKTPGGVYTEVTIPIKDIVKGIGKKKFSSVNLSLKAYPPNDWAYSLQFPGSPKSLVPVLSSDGSTGASAQMLLIEPDSVKNFFEMKKVADFQTTYTCSFDSVTYTYNFNNIANLVQNAINKAPDKDLVLWLVPVQTTWALATTSTGSSVPVPYMTSHYLYPSGVTLRKDIDNMKVRVIATDLTIDK